MAPQIDAILDALADRVAEKVAERLAASAPTAPADDGKQQLWPEHEVAKQLGVSVPFLKKARQDGEIVAATDKRPILYGRTEIEAVKVWLKTR